MEVKMKLSDMIEDAYYIQKNINRSMQIREWFFKNFRYLRHLPSNHRPDEYIINSLQLHEILSILEVKIEDLSK